MTTPDTPHEGAIHLAGSQTHFRLENDQGELFTSPWTAIGPLADLLLSTMIKMNFITPVALANGIIAGLAEQQETRYRMCRWNGTAWVAVADDGVTPDTTMPQNVVWRPDRARFNDTAR